MTAPEHVTGAAAGTEGTEGTEGTDPAVTGLDLARLQAYLATRLPDYAGGALSARLLTGGRSNLSYAVTDGTHRWVVRRPPLGKVLATAHDMGREYRVQTALAGSAVPVPRTMVLCSDPEVLGAPFYVMEQVPGVAVRDLRQLSRFGPSAVAELIFGLVDTLTDLHAIPPDTVGLSDFGRPEGYNARQLDRWSRQLAASDSAGIPGVGELEAALAGQVPPSPLPTIVHGDYRLDNVLVLLPDPPGAPRVTAVLDWEMSTLGDPLGDLALMLLYASRTLPGVTGEPGSEPAVTVPGHPSTADMVARYADRSGRDVGDLRWYEAFARYKLAAIAQGVYHRYQQGAYGQQTGFAMMGDVVAPLIADGLGTLKER